MDFLANPIQSDTGLLSERRKISNNLTHHLKELEKEEQTKSKVSTKDETIKIREEIKKIEFKKSVEKNQYNQELVLWKGKQN